jgi:hypothetical protein
MEPRKSEVLARLAQVEQNAWMLFSELPPSQAKTRALHVYLDAKAMKTALAVAVLEAEAPGVTGA